MATVTIETLTKVLPLMIDQRIPVLIRGRHGIGKSDIARQLAEKLGKKLINLRAGLFTEGEQLGLPVKEATFTTYRPPKWLYLACTEPVVLFLDELDRGILEVRQGFFQLADSREIAGWELHEDTVVLAAINGGEGASQYQVGDLDPAELDRWATFDLEPSVKDWLHWGKDNIHPTVLDFITDNPEHLEHGKEFNPGAVYPSRRSWHRFSNVLLSNDGLQDDVGALTTIGSSLVGVQAALSFEKFVRSNGFGIRVEDVIDKGKMLGVDKMPVGAVSALIDKINMKGYWKKRLTKKQIDNLIKFFKLIPNESAAQLWADICAHCTTSQREKIQPMLRDQFKKIYPMPRF